MPKHEWLREHLEPILREHSDRYWLCYQILNRLRERAPEVLDQLEAQYGTGYGQGGGSQFRPDSAIALCLSDWPECVDVQHLHGKDLSIGDIRASYDWMGIYHWLESGG